MTNKRSLQSTCTWQYPTVEFLCPRATSILNNGFLFALGSEGVSWKYMFSGNVRGMSAIEEDSPCYRFQHFPHIMH